MPTPLPGARASALAAAVGLTALVSVAACSDEPGNTVAAYCDEVRANIDALVSPNVITTADIAPLLDRYRSIADVAPATVGEEWQELVQAMETASTVVAGDAESMAVVANTALAGEPGYKRIQEFTQTECGIAIGNPPPPTNPVTATTVVPPTTGG